VEADPAVVEADPAAVEVHLAKFPEVDPMFRAQSTL